MGIALPVAYVLRLNLPVVFLCALLPDLVDKPLWALGVGAPRYIGHTVLFIVLVTAAFFLWKRAYGIAAFLGGASHLLLDWLASGPAIPWLYPFMSYTFPEREFDPSGFFPNLWDTIQDYFFLDIGKQLIWVAVACVAAFLLVRLYRRYRFRRRAKRGKPPLNQPGDSAQ